jgi:hypothetical protein
VQRSQGKGIADGGYYPFVDQGRAAEMLAAMNDPMTDSQEFRFVAKVAGIREPPDHFPDGLAMVGHGRRFFSSGLLANAFDQARRQDAFAIGQIE